MSPLTLLLIRLAFLAILWLFVIAAVGVVRTDMFGTSSSGRKASASAEGSSAPEPGRRAAAGTTAASRTGCW